MSSGDESSQGVYGFRRSTPEIDDEIGSTLGIENEEAEEPLESIEVQEENPETEDNKKSDDEGQNEKQVVKPKRVVKNPRPKFNEQTLKTSKGLPAIAGHFKRVKFKGKGHEEKDLNMLMKTYEYWCHRLFPLYPFETSIARLETLGTKKATQVQLKILRAGLDLEEDKNLLSDEDVPTTDGFEDVPASNGFEDVPETIGFVNQFDQLLPRTVVEKEAEISEEQLERMKQNRMRAEALKRQRIAKAKVVNETDISPSVSHMEDNIIREPSEESGRVETDVQDSEEVDFDSILNMVNEEDPRNSEDGIKSTSNVNAVPSVKGNKILIDNETEIHKNSSNNKRGRILDSDDEEFGSEDIAASGSQENQMNKDAGENIGSDEDLISNQSKPSKKRQNVIESDEDE